MTNWITTDAILSIIDAELDSIREEHSQAGSLPDKVLGAIDAYRFIRHRIQQDQF